VNIFQWRVAERTLTVANRAYVTATATIHAAGLKDPSPVPPGSMAVSVLAPEKTRLEGGDLSYQVKMTNTGATPAMQMAGMMTATLSTKMPLDLRSITIDPTKPPWNQQSTATLAKDGSSFYPVQLGARLTAEHIQAIEGKRQYLVVFGQVDYVDVFNAKHRTEVCFVYLPTTFGMGHCPQHNNMD